MAEFEMTPVVVGHFPAFPLNRFLLGAQDGVTIEAPCLSWVARNEAGRLTLVDTGPLAPTAETSKVHIGLEVRPEHRIDRALERAGFDPADVDTVVFTHLHFDHCAYGEHLPNSRFIVQAAELRYAVLPDRAPQRIAYEVGYDRVFPSWFTVFDRLITVDGVYEVAPGCRMLPLPGHSPGSAGVVFDTALGRVAVVGDLVNQIENWRSSAGSHIPPALHTDLDACLASFAVLEHEADIVVASHDYRMLEEWS
jgi:N-acyl homoserine lactone hydrolase